MASTYLSRTFGTADNYTKQTFSAWVKRGSLGGSQMMISGYNGSSSFSTQIDFNSDQLRVEFGGASQNEVKTNALYRDTNAWYHIVIAIDTTQATASDRIKFYVNGEQITSFALSNYPAQNDNSQLTYANSNNTVGASWNSNDKYDGSMSHINFIDGTAYDATAFGQYDANGVWTIKTSPSVTYGNNGFFILKDGNSVTDQSGNGNNWTVAGGTLTNTEDNPSNVFATLNALDNFYVGGTFSNGNTTVVTDVVKYAGTYSTIGASSGKYYCEMKKISGSAFARFGILSRPPIDTGSTSAPGNSADSVGLYIDGNYYINSSSTAYGDSFTTGDIIGVAMDLDNSKLYFSKNGVWQNSGDPTSGATGTGAINIPTATTGYYHFAMGDQHDGENGTYSINFGNGYFGTTAVASAGTNASGIGIFEYDVPTGFTALSTKGLNL